MMGLPTWLGGALGGAAGGALVGGLPGAIIGGLLGGISAASAAETAPQDQGAGGAQTPVDESVRLIQMQASNTSYIAAAAELARNVIAQTTVGAMTPPAPPTDQYRALIEEIQRSNEFLNQQSQNLQNIDRSARRTAEGIGDFA
jgi:hypothetical protein